MTTGAVAYIGYVPSMLRSPHTVIPPAHLPAL